MRLQDKRSFKALNFDDANEYLEDGDMRSALNVRVGYSESGDDGIITNVKGTVSLFSELEFSLPTGTNKCIGTCTDDQSSRLIWLNYNSNGNHGIYCYNTDSNTIQTVLVTSELNFSTEIIHSIDILNGNLAWVDDNRPRAINVDSAIAGDLGGTIIEELINDAKVVPMFPPECTSTVTFGSEFIQSLKSFQFIYRYVFIGGEKGAWSTVSKLVPTAYRDEHIEKITLNLNACEIFTKVELRNVIEYVEFASRELYTLNFNQFLRISTDDLVGSGGFVDYYDTESKTPLDTTTDTNIPFYENPIKAGSVCFQSDRKFYADCTEGYDAFNLSPSLSGVSTDLIPSSGSLPYLSDCSTHIGDRYLKPDSEYSYSVEFHDKYGRKSGAIDLPALSIKTAEQISNDYKANVLNFTANLAADGSYPDWAEKFEIIRSDNKTVTYFVQGRVNKVYYCTGYDSDGDPTYINSNPNVATPNISDTSAIEIHIDIGNWTQFGTNIGYTWSEGDRVTFFTMGGVLDSSGTPVLKGLKIKELRGSLLIVDYPLIGRTNLNHAGLSDSLYLNGIVGVNEVLSRFIVGDNGTCLYSRIDRQIIPITPPGPPTLLTFPFPYTGITTAQSIPTNFPTVTNNLYCVSLVYSAVQAVVYGVDIFIVGSEGFFIRGNVDPSTNVFGSWNTANPGVTTDLNYIENNYGYPNKTNLIIVGDQGVILNYNVSTGVFTPRNSGVTVNLNCVYRDRDTNTIVACGDGGTILRSTDGGVTWTQIAIDNCQNLNGIYISDIYAVAVGDEGLCLNSTDGGVTWIQQNISTVSNLNSIEGQGNSSNTVYVAGDSGYLGQFDMVNGNLILGFNTGTTKDINFFQSYYITNGTYPNDLGILVGDLDLLMDCNLNVAPAVFTNYSTDVVSIFGTIYLNYRAKIEVYSPRTVSGPVIYYETGDAYAVGANYTFRKGLENDGDVFFIRKDFRGDDWTMSGDLIFSMTPNSFDTGGTWDKDLGRPNTVLLYPEQQQRRNIIRYSDKYVQDSKINGLSNFQSSNYEPIPNEYGWIRKITPLEYVLLINAERESATAYIDQTVFRGTDGQDVAATSDRVINNVRKLVGGFGCTNPESIASYLGFVYWFSSNKGAVCRYNTGNGIFPISEYKARTYFNSIKNNLSEFSVLNGGYEPKFRNYLLSIINKDPSAIELLDISGTIAEDSGPGTLDPLNNRIYWRKGTMVQVVSAQSGVELTTIDVGIFSPQTPTYDSVNQRMYISDKDDNKVYVINTSDYSLASTITVGTGPRTPVYDSANQRMYVLNYDSDSVSVINTSTFAVIATISVGNAPVQGVFDSANNRVYVVNSLGQSVSVISTASNTVIATISLSAAPIESSRIYISGSSLYVTVANAVDIISTTSNTLTSTISTSITDGQSVLDTITSTLFISDNQNSRIGYIDCINNTFTGYVTLSVAKPRAGAIDTYNELLIVVCDDYISFVDINSKEEVKILEANNSSSNEVNYPVQVPDLNLIYFMTGPNYEYQVSSTDGYLTKETIAFQEGTNRWIARYSFWPERFGYVDNEMFSLLSGELWKHNSSNTYNNFHGTQYTSQLRPVFNKEPNIQKNFTSMSLEGDKVWAASSITTPEGQESFILSGHFEKIQHDWYADIKNDINTPNAASTDEALINGNFMQSNVLEVLLELTASDIGKLNSVNVNSNTFNR
jgi:YVTN family beta-propeller protein